MSKDDPRAGASAVYAGALALGVSLDRLAGNPFARLPIHPALIAAFIILLVGFGVFLAVRDVRLLAPERRRNGPARTMTPQGREIWFERWSGGYNPVHWKGWVLVALTGPGMLLGAGVAVWADDSVGHPEWLSPIGALLIGFLYDAWMVERHCAPRVGRSSTPPR